MQVVPGFSIGYLFDCGGMTKTTAVHLCKGTNLFAGHMDAIHDLISDHGFKELVAPRKHLGTHGPMIRSVPIFSEHSGMVHEFNEPFSSTTINTDILYSVLVPLQIQHLENDS